MTIAMLCVLNITSALNAISTGCMPTNTCSADIDAEAYQRGRDDEAQGVPYHSYVRSKKRYSYNLGRKEMREKLQANSHHRTLKISPQTCQRRYGRTISSSDLYAHGPMYNNPNYIQALR